MKLLSMIAEIDLGIIQFTAIANDVKLANRILGTVTASATTGDAFLNGEGSRCITQPVMGCASRSRVRSDQPFGQGQTADRVLIHLNTEPSASDLINILSSVVLRVGLETFWPIVSSARGV